MSYSVPHVQLNKLQNNKKKHKVCNILNIFVPKGLKVYIKP